MEKMGYEFHVTVKEDGRVSDFVDACDELGVKPIVLDLGINRGVELTDVMTSSKQKYDSDEEAFNELGRIGEGLSENGFVVVRRKIEAAPWHPLAPQNLKELMPEGCYFESHMAIAIPLVEVEYLREEIAETADVIPLHLSRNAFKPLKDGKVVMMTTLRDYESCYEDFSVQVEAASDRIHEIGYALTKVPIVEFSMYDSNTMHDNEWIRAN